MYWISSSSFFTPCQNIMSVIDDVLPWDSRLYSIVCPSTFEPKSQNRICPSHPIPGDTSSHNFALSTAVLLESFVHKEALCTKEEAMGKRNFVIFHLKIGFVTYIVRGVGILVRSSNHWTVRRLYTSKSREISKPRIWVLWW